MAKKKKVTTTVTTTVTEEIISSNEKTHIICILDRSGSMSSIISDSIGGFNTFLKQQKELPDEATITVALFDDRYELLYDNVNIKEAEELTKNTWIPRGTTALYDAIGKTINGEKQRFNKLGKEAPAKILVCIVTDGLENASKEYKIDNIRDLIKECENDDWNFIYLAANQDAFSVGQSFGVSAGNTYTYTANSTGVMDMINTVNYATTNYRAMNTSDANFKKMSKNLIDENLSDYIYSGNSITTTGTQNFSTYNSNNT